MEIVVATIAGLAVAGLVVAVGLLDRRVHELRHTIDELNTKPKPLAVSQPTEAQLEAELKAAYEAKITEATATFGADLKVTSTKLSEQVARLTTSVIEEELTAYQQTLEQVRTTATQAMEDIRSAVEQQRAELHQGMERDVAAERDRLIAKFDTKLGDVVSSYIAESLGGGVDLGAQLQFIVSSLEAHKDDLKKDLGSGV